MTDCIIDYSSLGGTGASADAKQAFVASEHASVHDESELDRETRGVI